MMEINSYLHVKQIGQVHFIIAWKNHIFYSIICNFSVSIQKECFQFSLRRNCGINFNNCKQFYKESKPLTNPYPPISSIGYLHRLASCECVLLTGITFSSTLRHTRNCLALLDEKCRTARMMRHIVGSTVPPMDTSTISTQNNYFLN